jgi:hypothetical protein
MGTLVHYEVLNRKAAKDAKFLLLFLIGETDQERQHNGIVTWGTLFLNELMVGGNEAGSMGHEPQTKNHEL